MDGVVTKDPKESVNNFDATREESTETSTQVVQLLLSTVCDLTETTEEGSSLIRIFEWHADNSTCVSTVSLPLSIHHPLTLNILTAAQITISNNEQKRNIFDFLCIEIYTTMEDMLY